MDLHGNIFKVASVECDFSFAEVIENEKEELRDRLLQVYFKDEPTLFDMINDDEKWEEYFRKYNNIIQVKAKR
jgi:glycogen debranching enzyme